MSDISVHVAIPCMDELHELPRCLGSLYSQTLKNFDVWVCVNQPQSWWSEEIGRGICERNLATIHMLRNYRGLKLHVLDRCSRGRGWSRRKSGVGMARGEILRAIEAVTTKKALIVNLDADTTMDPNYLERVVKIFRDFPETQGMLVPYYHHLSGEERMDRAILRYEIYMRIYLISLLKIESPYAFTALGSALSFPLGSYLAVGGFPARAAGEDFYMAQKLRKLGAFCIWGAGPVYPSSRPSSRVPFGTGPSVRSGAKGRYDSYPLFPFEFFLEIKATEELFEELFHRDVSTPMDSFFQRVFGRPDPFKVLRRDHKKPESFIRACHGRLDALRIFQYLRYKRNLRKDLNDEEITVSFLNGPLRDFFEFWVSNLHKNTRLTVLAERGWRYDRLPCKVLSELRDFLFYTECRLREKRFFLK